MVIKWLLNDFRGVHIWVTQYSTKSINNYQVINLGHPNKKLLNQWLKVQLSHHGKKLLIPILNLTVKFSIYASIVFIFLDRIYAML
jgi:hypothetical protein